MILEEEIDEFLEHGIKLHRAGSILEAKEYYQKVLNKSPNNSDALNLLKKFNAPSDKIFDEFVVS